MNSAASQPIRISPQFEINAELRPDDIYEVLCERGHVQVCDFLAPANAAVIYQDLTRNVEWKSFLVSNGELFVARPNSYGIYPADLESGLFELAYGGARRGFAHLYEATRLYAEDIPEDAPPEDGTDTPLLSQFTDFLNSHVFIDFVRRVTGIPEIDSAAAQATRFRAGHFEAFHNATHSADATGNRAAAFSYNLTPEWKPEWGGLLEFRNSGGLSVDAFVPLFNTLDIYLFPHGHWVSAVAPFAGGPRLAISGRLYVNRTATSGCEPKRE